MGDGWGGLGHYPGPAEPAEINIDRQVAKRVDQSIKDLYEYANKIYRLDNTNSISYDNIVKNKKKYDGEVFVIWYTDYTYNDRDNKVFRLNYHELRLP
jgi:hypothetical protein